jgi:hypothetical protein
MRSAPQRPHVTCVAVFLPRPADTLCTPCSVCAATAGQRQCHMAAQQERVRAAAAGAGEQQPQTRGMQHSSAYCCLPTLFLCVMQLRAGCLEVPFNTMPPEGGLPTLPPYLMYRQVPPALPSCSTDCCMLQAAGAYARRRAVQVPSEWKGGKTQQQFLAACCWRCRFVSPPKQPRGEYASTGLFDAESTPSSSSACLAGCGSAGLMRPRSAGAAAASSPTLRQL